ncbi:MAG TPA: hypothetical protein VKU84_07845, partial [Stellaceae bacterium]|nr:hypothetical protein [Stellaceae bacterium]
MGKKRRRSNGEGHTRYVALQHWMLNHPAWKALSPDAKALLIEVWLRHNGTNNGTISYAVREAEVIGLSRNMAARAFAELVSRGFLVCTRASAFTVKTRAARLWRLTAERSGPTGSDPATKEFMTMQPHSPAHGTVKSRTQSHQRDVQSHQRDCEPFRATKLPLTV